MPIIAFSGHRPHKLRNPALVHQNLTNFLTLGLEKYESITGISGGAIGVDTIAAEVMYELDIPYRLYAPCFNQDARWNNHQKRRYQLILGRAVEVRYIYAGDYPGPKVMWDRNEAMVDDCDFVVAVHDGGSKGGTAHCVGYAKSQGKLVVPIHPDVSYTFN